MKNTTFFSAKFYFFLASFFAISAFILNYSNSTSTSNNKAVEEFQKIILKKDKLAKQFLQQLIAQNDSLTAKKLFKKLNSGTYNDLLKEKIDFFRYRNDTLRFWSTNKIPVENTLQSVCLDKPVVQLKNGWYRVIRSPKKAKQFFVLYPIKQTYSISNDYLEELFPFYPGFSSSTQVNTLNNSDYQIKDNAGNYLFSLSSVSFNINQSSNYILLYLCLLCFISLCAGIIQVIKQKNKIRNFALFTGLLLLIRLILLVTKWPSFFYELPLFDPVVYANSYFNSSLGELMLNIILIGTIVVFLRVLFINSTPIQFSKLSSYFKIFPILIFHTLFSVLVIDIVPSFIKDSTIKFDPTNFIALETLGWAGFLLISFLFLFYILWVDLIFKLVKNTNQKTVLLSIILFALIVVYFSHENIFITCTLYFLVHFTFFISQKINRNLFSLHFVILGIVCFSVLFSLSIHTQIREKQITELRALADNFSEERDPIAEYLFGDISEKLSNDSIFEQQLKTNLNTDDTYKRLVSKYFNGYWDKYNSSIVIYDSMCNILLKPQQLVEDRLLFFEEIEKKQTSVSSKYKLFPYLFSSDLSGSYLGKISRRNAKNELQYNVYIELKPKLYYTEFGFPSLLLEKRIKDKQIDFSGFSFAKYLQGKLINSVGNYNYHTAFEIYNASNLKSDFFEYEDYIHITKKINNKNSIVVSRKSIGRLELMNLFSYWFLLLLFVSFIAFIIFQIYNRFNLFTNHLRNRIQGLLVITISLIFILIGWWNVSFIKNQYSEKNSKSLNEKTNSIMLELQGKLGSEKSLNYSSNEYLNYILTRFSNVFYTDLNLFDRKGNLLSSSRNAVFENGLISKMMDPVSYHNLTLDTESKFIHTETIGKLPYLSSYVPFINDEGKLLAYLNLPYFSKQNELEIEISSVIVTLLNIYVLFFVLSISIAIFVSNRIVQPLKILQAKLKTVQLNKKNEAIVWQGKDEIGVLIIEYNRMIKELVHSAEKLAQSEREGAWREMAKQVAHEIKNPLTPMKLNVQQFERVWKDASDKEKEQLMKKFSSAMIEQIDTLSTIASEFSNFAQLPGTKFSKIDIVTLTHDVVHLFENSNSCKIKIESDANYFVNGDKEQLVRVFNNLIKNAIQSVEEHIEPNIKIHFTHQDLNLLITISDNGKGISDEIRHKIFSPNFTTKSTGMGLGLAMVKNTIESHNGSISFESEVNKRTVFTIILPLFAS